MKVIVAGMSKTGTKTLAAALKELGYNVYDYLENYEYLGKEWNEIMTTGGSTEDFRRMFQDVDAVTDVPACYFWKEIHDAFPDSKIIFMQRDEDEWWNSMNNQIRVGDRFWIKIMRYMSPTNWFMYQFGTKITTSVFGCTIRRHHPLARGEVNELLFRMTYRRHNAGVLELAPKDKLLEFDLKDGWKPLCDFLSVPVPQTPFPHKNKKGNIMDEMLATNPTLIRCKREMAASSALLSVLFAYGMYKAVTKRSSILTFFNSLCAGAVQAVVAYVPK